MRALTLLFVLWLCGGATALLAQSSPLEPGIPWYGGQAGVSFGTPLKGSATVILMRGRSAGIDTWWGENVVLDVGLGGGKARLGRFSYGANSGSEYGLSLLHTWGEPWQVGPAQTFAGAEVQVSVLPLTLSLGGFIRVRGDDGGNPLLVSATLGARLLPL